MTLLITKKILIIIDILYFQKAKKGYLKPLGDILRNNREELTCVTLQGCLDKVKSGPYVYIQVRSLSYDCIKYFTSASILLPNWFIFQHGRIK